MYWPPLFIDNSHVDLSHLEPFFLECPAPGGLLVRINARFSNHCFTEAFDDAKHDPRQLIMDHKRPRAFDQQRYDLSRRLPDMVRALPQSKVHQTPEGRNYLYFTTLAELPDAEYRMFFHLKRATGQAHHLELFIESAYPADGAGKRQPKRPSAIRFSVLAQKIHLGQPVRFAPR